MLREVLISCFILIPLFSLLVSLLIPGNREHALARVGILSSLINLVLFLMLLLAWAINGFEPINLKEITIYKSLDYEFFIDLYFDKVTAVYLFTGGFLTLIITAYSRYYIHRENGYKRFFNTLLFFYLAYNVTVLAGNFETLFVGWEMLGISSFLLISFYRERYLPIRNAVKVFTIYRIGDIGILLTMWASHHLWHENITFSKLNNQEIVSVHLSEHSLVGTFIALMLLLAALAKSAQFPFSSWLPRAMEGPTTSSAIFYGSLSVNIGVFLLIRTFPYWENQIVVRIVIAIIGIVTAITSISISRVQSSIKTQIAYSSIAQIAIIFIEIASGFTTLALFHFLGNAFLRTYQLLISPSVVTYLVKEQFYEYKEKDNYFEDFLPRRLRATLFLLGVQEWNLDNLTNRIIFQPLKSTGRLIYFVNYKFCFYILIPLLFIGVIMQYKWLVYADESIKSTLAGFYAVLGMLFTIRGFAERDRPRLVVILIMLYHILITMAVSFNSHYHTDEILIYLSGIIVSGALGIGCLTYIKRNELKHTDIREYYGHIYEYPKLGVVFLFACLGLMGFPITTAFIGEDLLYSHISERQYFLAICASGGFIIGGIALIRTYARIFLGPHVKTYHATATKSS